MMINKYSALNEKDKNDINQLVSKCLKADGLERTLYLENDLNFFKDMDCFFLLYINDKLVSVLSVFEILEDEAEISAYTLPEERNKGYFSVLYQHAKEELNKFHISNILFVVEPASKSGLSAVQACHAEYDKSEYLLMKEMLDFDLEANRMNQNRCNDNQLIEIKELQQEEIPEAAKLSSVLFDSGIEEESSAIKGTLESDQMNCYSMFKSDKMIGICSISYQKESAFLYGLGIAPEFQGRGYGRILLNLMFEKIYKGNYRRIKLEVNSLNQKAFNLYKSAGFQIITQYDYYKIKL